jgi:two-component system cell cycle sensor histidine kinase/response regulator CckA
MATADTGHPPPGTGKTVLVLDDEADVRKLITTTLKSDGYRVLAADNGESAIKAFKKSKQPVDLLLLDVVSPGMSGPMVADRIAELQPGLPVLFMSGYGDSSVVRSYVVHKGYALLPKPFTGEQLAKQVSYMLASVGR